MSIVEFNGMEIDLTKFNKVEDKLPEEGRLVIYYFYITGFHLGFYQKSYCKELDAYGDTFYNDSGWLTDDVTHWIYYEPVETITDNHYNGFDPSGIEYTCTKCWTICLSRGMEYCPKCGTKLKWELNSIVIAEHKSKR